MTPELQQYYENRFDMMSSKGWQDLIEDVSQIHKSYNELSAASTFEEFHKRKGQVDILNWILSLKSASEQTYEELQRETNI